jgi:hypothetical protein
MLSCGVDSERVQRFYKRDAPQRTTKRADFFPLRELLA